MVFKLKIVRSESEKIDLHSREEAGVKGKD